MYSVQVNTHELAEWRQSMCRVYCEMHSIRAIEMIESARTAIHTERAIGLATHTITVMWVNEYTFDFCVCMLRVNVPRGE